MMDYFGWRRALLCLLGSISLTSAASCSSAITITHATALKTAFKGCTEWIGDVVVSGITATPTSSSLGISIPTLVAVKSGSLTFSDIQGPGDTGQKSDKAGASKASSGGSTFSLSAPKLQSVQGVLNFNNMDNVNFGDFSSLGSAGGISISGVNFADDTYLNNTADGPFPALLKLKSMEVMQTTNAVMISFSPPLEPPNEEVSASMVAIDNKDLNRIEVDFAVIPGVAGYFQNVEITTRDNKPGDFEVTLANDISQASLRLSGVSSFNGPGLITLVSDSTIDPQILSENTFPILDLGAVTNIKGTFIIQNNEGLNTINFPTLAQVGGLKILNNSMLSNTPILPTTELTFSRNDVNLQSSLEGPVTLDCSGGLDCASLNLENASECECSSASIASSPPSSTETTGSNASGSSSNNGGLSSGAKIGIGVGVGVGVALLLASVLFFCCRNRRGSSDPPREISTGRYSDSQPTYSGGGAVAYSRVKNESAFTEEMRDSPNKEYTRPTRTDNPWSPEQTNVHPMYRRREVDEQRSITHEMDARSLPDIDYDEEDEADTRSLDDIERTHGQR